MEDGGRGWGRSALGLGNQRGRGMREGRLGLTSAPRDLPANLVASWCCANLTRPTHAPTPTRPALFAYMLCQCDRGACSKDSGVGPQTRPPAQHVNCRHNFDTPPPPPQHAATSTAHPPHRVDDPTASQHGSNHRRRITLPPPPVIRHTPRPPLCPAPAAESCDPAQPTPPCPRWGRAVLGRHIEIISAPQPGGAV